MKTLVAGCLLALAVVGGAEAAELVVLSAGAVKPVVPGLVEQFQQETGHTVKLTFDTVGALRRRAAAEPADLLIMSDVAIDDMIKQGLAVAGTRMDLARVGVGVAVKQGGPLPDISSVDAFKRTVLAARSIVYNDPAIGATSGIHFAAVLQRLGIADQVKDKTILWKGGYAAEALVTGQAEICVHQISEILPVKGVVLVGPLPKDLQKVTVYSAALAAKSANADAAKTLLAFIARPQFKPKFAAAGLDYKE
jgi:molybdate transport system substrate-binding protein